MKSDRRSPSKDFVMTLLAHFLLLLLLPCAAAKGTKTKSQKILLPGAAGSGPFQVIAKWATAFNSLYPEAEITFSSVGSGAAQSALWGDVDCETRPVEGLCGIASKARSKARSTIWGIGDAPFQPSAYTEHSKLQLQQYPACAGAVVVAHSRDVLTGNLGTAALGSEEDEEDIGGVNLTFDLLAGILNGTIQYWDDPKLVTQNADITLPNEPITVVVMAESSGQSFILTKAVGFHVPSWPETAIGAFPEWPLTDIKPLEQHSASCSSDDVFSMNTPPSFKGQGKEGVVMGLLRIPYSIGYMELGHYQTGLSAFLGQAKLSHKNDEAVFCSATERAVQATMNELAKDMDPVTLDVDLTTGTVDGGYPVSGWAYWYVSHNPDSYDSCYQAWLLAQFIEWSYTNPQAAAIASQHGWISPPQSVVDIALNRLQDITCRNERGDIVSALSYVPEPYQFDMNYLEKSHRIVAWTLASVILASSVLFMLWVMWRRNTRVVRASQPVFLLLICFGTLMTGSAIFPLGIDDGIASDTGCDIACMSWVWLIPCGFTITYSALYSKIRRLNMLVHGASRFQKLKIKASDVLGPFIVLITVNVGLLISWTVVDPLTWHRVEDGMFSSYGICKSDNSAWLGFLSAIVCVNFAALVGALIEAYKARKLSDEFSESSYIGFAMISMLQALLLGLPLVFVVESPSARLFTFTGILFILSMSLLLLIFIPKTKYVRLELRYGGREHYSKSSSSGMRVRVSALEGEEDEGFGEKPLSNVTGSTNISKQGSFIGASVASQQADAANSGFKQVSFNGEMSNSATPQHQPRGLPDITETSERSADAAHRTGERISPPHSRGRGSGTLSAAGQAVIGMDQQHLQQARAGGDGLSLTEDDHIEKMMSSSFAPSESSFNSAGSSIPMVRVEELPPEIANWYFRTHFQN